MLTTISSHITSASLEEGGLEMQTFADGVKEGVWALLNLAKIPKFWPKFL